MKRLLPLLLCIAGAMTLRAATLQEFAVMPESDFVYRMPCGKRIYAQVVQRTPVEAHHYHEDNLVNFTCLQFSWRGNDGRVYAARKGVASIKNDYVEVTHSDGTIARYAGLATTAVKEGQSVMPDTVMGTAEMDEEGGFTMEFELYFLTPKPEGHRTRTSYLRRYIDPVFATSRGAKQLDDGTTHKAKVNKKLINKEQ